MSDNSKWHKGSRYWKYGMYVVLLATVLSVFFQDPTPFVVVAPVFLGGAGAKTTVVELNRPKYSHLNGNHDA